MQLVNNDRSNEVAADDEENIHANITATKVLKTGMKQQHGQHSKRANHQFHVYIA